MFNSTPRGEQSHRNCSAQFHKLNKKPPIPTIHPSQINTNPANPTLPNIIQQPQATPLQPLPHHIFLKNVEFDSHLLKKRSIMGAATI